MSRKSKGDAKEQLRSELLQKEGYITHIAGKKIRRFFKGGKMAVITIQHDIFQTFDIIGFNEDNFILSQVTHYGHELERMEKIKRQLREHPPPPCTIIEVAAWKGGRRKLDKRYKDRKVWVAAQVFYLHWWDESKKKFGLYMIIDKNGDEFIPEEKEEKKVNGDLEDPQDIWI